MIQKRIAVSRILLVVAVIFFVLLISGVAVILSTSKVSSTSASSTTCVSTPTSSNQPASIIVPLLNAYSAVTQTLQGSLNDTTSNFNASYTVISENSTTYQVNIIDTTPTHTYSTTVWLLRDGTVAALDFDGFNFEGALANSEFQTYFYPWEWDIYFGQQIMSYSTSSYFRSTGSSTVTLGPSTFTLQSYAPSSLPETITVCNNDASITLTSGGNFSVGRPTGSDYPLVTNLEAVGTVTNIGSSGTPVTTTYNFTSTITSVTVT